jgi:hypothetical protein
MLPAAVVLMMQVNPTTQPDLCGSRLVIKQPGKGIYFFKILHLFASPVGVQEEFLSYCISTPQNNGAHEGYAINGSGNGRLVHGGFPAGSPTMQQCPTNLFNGLKGA